MSGVGIIADMHAGGMWPGMRMVGGSPSVVVLCAALPLGGFALFCGAGALPAEEGRASKPQVGSAMAVLATLAQAQVLPPEHSPEATKIVQAVIQFQSAFIKSRDPAIQEFATQALRAKYGAQAPLLLTDFRSKGWTAAMLEALAEAEGQAMPAELQTLAPGFAPFNLSVEDFHRLMELVRRARQALASKGLVFEEVYASHRRTMPGATKETATPESSERL
jgi:hypothetical protein